MKSLNDTRTGEQIYFTIEHGPEIPEMKVRLLAGPWRRVALKRDTGDLSLACFHGKAHHN